jgi:hypothetical protein
MTKTNRTKSKTMINMHYTENYRLSNTNPL